MALLNYLKSISCWKWNFLNSVLYCHSGISAPDHKNQSCDVEPHGCGVWKHRPSITDQKTIAVIIPQCVPIKRKPVLSVRYLHCHARFNQTICFIIKGIFSSLILIPNTWWLSQCMNEKEQFKLMHVKTDLRRIMVLSWYDQVQTS